MRAAEGHPLEERYWLVEAERTARTWHEQLLALTPFAPLLEKHVAQTVDEPNELWSRLGVELKKPRTLDELHQALGRALELIDDETEKWGKVIRAANIRAE